jgi:hypothetical protein
MIAGCAIVAMTGCSDSPTSPRAPTANHVDARGNPSLDYTGPFRFAGLRSTTFTLTAAGGSYDIGGGFYTLNVPADGVCVLESSYGPGEWDAPCQTLSGNQTITVTATFGFARGGPMVDFSPGLRFNPNSQVTLSTGMYAPLLTTLRPLMAQNSALLRHFAMYYTSDFGASGAADAAFDPTAVTHVNLRSGMVWRRVKHFSGYYLAGGMPCDPSPDDPNCSEGPPPVVDGM